MFFCCSTPLFYNIYNTILESEKTTRMGQRHNRKRVRHRPNRARKHLELATSSLQPLPYLTTPTALSIRYSYNQPSRCSKQISSRSPTTSSRSSFSSSTCSREENAIARDLRIFGGLENEPDSTDLRGPMLDVVLGLFNGLDYEDASC